MNKEVEDLAKMLYGAYTANHPTIHTNRFPTWDELVVAERRKWLKEATKKLATSKRPESR